MDALVSPKNPASPSAGMPETLHSLLARHAREHADSVFVHALDENGQKLTYADAWLLALRWKAFLLAHGVARGDVVHIALRNGIDFVGAFFGALALGAMAAPMVARRDLPAERFLADLSERHLAGTRAVCVVAAADAVGLRWDAGLIVPVGELPPVTWSPFATDGEAVAVLQFTSGTSSKPKAVALSHRALFHQMAAINAALEINPNIDHAVSWLPLFHDMGLIGFLLTPLLVAGKVALMQTESFMAHPWRWLDAVAQTGATITGAPPSAWRLVSRFASSARVSRAPLHTLRAALLGAERIDGALMAKVCERLAPAGFDPAALVPAYGMAEIGLAATIMPLGQGVKARAVETPDLGSEDIVCCGRPVTDTRLRIVGEFGEPLAEGTVGRVEILTPSLMSGYFGDPVRTAAALKQGWYHTGDLGFMAEGFLYLIGRADEQIVVAGRKYAPEMFERLVAEVPGLAGMRAAAFGLRDPESGTERAVLLVEHRAADPEAFKLLRLAAAQRDLPLAIVKGVRPGTIEFTRNGKLPRAKLRMRFSAGFPNHDD